MKDLSCPVLTFDDIQARLHVLENKYTMPSKEFYQLWKADKIDHVDSLRWAILYECFLDYDPGLP